MKRFYFMEIATKEKRGYNRKVSIFKIDKNKIKKLGHIYFNTAITKGLYSEVFNYLMENNHFKITKVIKDTLSKEQMEGIEQRYYLGTGLQNRFLDIMEIEL